jgi:ADP-heptose:LPS heptosyltransferase
VVILRGWGMGDQLSITPLIYHLSKKSRVIVVSSNAELFQNLKIELVKPKGKLVYVYYNFLRRSLHSNIIGISEIPLSINNKKRLLFEAILHKRKDILKKYWNLDKKPVILFSKDEIDVISKKYDTLLKKDFGIVASEIKNSSLADVKNIGVKKIQKVINKTQKSIKWVQIGFKEDTPLAHVIDLRGKTSLRELFFLVSKSKLVFTQEGVLTHISAAFKTPCVTTYSGYHYPEISLYKNVIPVQPKPLPLCAYCWKSPCRKYINPLCIENIQIKEIISKIKDLISDR